jgi:hypothetical protein
MTPAPPIVTARLGQTAEAAAVRNQRIADWADLNPAMKIVAHGDSWMDYPEILLTGGGIPDHLSRLIGIPILNLAHHGDSTENSLGLAKRKQIEASLPGTSYFLFSGGGNDIAGDQFCLWLKDNPRSGTADNWDNWMNAIDWPRLAMVLEIINSDYRDLADIRDRVQPGCVMVTHGYDWPIPSDVGVCGLGPWLKPSLEYCGWTDPGDQYQIVKAVLSRFNLMIAGLPIKHHIHVSTQGTLAADEWANEIHPNRDGFEKIAQKFQAALAL